METNQLLILAIAGAAVYFVTRPAPAAPAPPPAPIVISPAPDTRGIASRIGGSIGDIVDSVIELVG